MCVRLLRRRRAARRAAAGVVPAQVVAGGRRAVGGLHGLAQAVAAAAVAARLRQALDVPASVAVVVSAPLRALPVAVTVVPAVSNSVSV